MRHSRRQIREKGRAEQSEREIRDQERRKVKHRRRAKGKKKYTSKHDLNLGFRDWLCTMFS